MDLELPVPAVETAAKTPRKKAAKSESKSENGGLREWRDVVAQIRGMREDGATVPQIAEALEVDYVLVNQVVLQSYKMTVDTLAVFERQEKRRLGIDA